MVRLGGKLELDLNQRVIEAAFLATLQSDERKVRQPLSDFDRIRSFVWSPVPSALSTSSGRRCSSWSCSCSTAAWQHSFRRFRRPPRVTLVHHLVTRPEISRSRVARRLTSTDAWSEVCNAQTLEAMGMLVNLQERWLRQRNEACTCRQEQQIGLAFSPA